VGSRLVRAKCLGSQLEVVSINASLTRKRGYLDRAQGEAS
jgi:hypothetical protein